MLRPSGAPPLKPLSQTENQREAMTGSDSFVPETEVRSAGAFDWISNLHSAPSRATRLPDEIAQEALNRLGPGPVSWVARTASDLMRDVSDIMPITHSAMAPEALEIVLVDMLARLIDHPLERFTRPALLHFLRTSSEGGTNVAQAMRNLNVIESGLLAVLLTECERWVPAADLPRAMRLLTSEVLSAHDHLAEMINEAATSQEPALLRDNLMLSLTSGFLSGRISPDRFSRTTGYRLDRVHIGAVAFSRLHEPKKLATQVQQTLAGLGCDQTFQVQIAPNMVWAWGSSANAHELLEHPPLTCSGSTVAIGLPGRGLSGFLDSHEEARALHRLASLAGWRNLGRALPYGEYGVIAELAAKPERLRRFLEVQLGDLMGGGARQADLRSTVLEYLNVNRSQTEAAQRLRVSKNTVSYRLRRAEEMLGHDLGTDLSSLHTALLAADLVGGVLSAQRTPEREQALAGCPQSAGADYPWKNPDKGARS